MAVSRKSSFLWLALLGLSVALLVAPKVCEAVFRSPEHEAQVTQEYSRHVLPKGFKFANPKAKQVKEAHKFLKGKMAAYGKLTPCEVAVKAEDDQTIIWLHLGQKKQCDKMFRMPRIVIDPVEEDMYEGDVKDYETTGKLGQVME